MDLSAVVTPADKIASAQPDFAGNVWFSTKAGLMGTVNLDRQRVLATFQMRRNEQILNSMAGEEEGGLFVASDHAMYRFDATRAGRRLVTWRQAYDPGTRVKPGQVGLGTGTTPTLMGSKYVAIADNADPRMNVLVYQRARNATGRRLVCRVPVFAAGASATENSLVGTDNSLVVENNYGYSGPEATTGGLTTSPGMTRIDISARGRCRVAWENPDIIVPSLITKPSVSNGLIYTYSKAPGLGTTDAWYLTTLDFRTGAVAYQQLAGTGPLFNNSYSGLFLGPDGSAYVGVLGGIVRVHDTE
ncbi:MAG: hypothetical protein ACOYEV_15545 [Candidatus Nanopelagicales bacterium]